MDKTAVNDLLDQYQRSFRMLVAEIGNFDEVQWLHGIDFFQVPVKVAMHIADCLDFYFSGKNPDDYRWGYRFGGGWWELPVDRLPDKALVLDYIGEIEARIVAELGALYDEDLSRPFPIADDSGATLLGHYIYALRHTLHHHGELSCLAVFHGREGGSWA